MHRSRTCGRLLRAASRWRGASRWLVCLPLSLPASGLLVGCGQSNASIAPSASAPAASASSAPVRDPSHVLALDVPKPAESRIDQSLAQLAKFTEEHPSKVDGWVTLGEAWVKKARESSDPGYYLNAKACADIALGLAPRDKLALNLVALVEMNNHEFQKALDTAGQILAADHDDPIALGTKSDALLELGSYDDAIAAADAMNKLKPNLPSYGRVGYLRWLKGNTEGAIEVMHLALDAGRGAKDNEPYAWTLVQSAMIFWNKGDYEGGKKGFDEALSVFPDYPPALVGKARYALVNGEAKNAAELLSKAHHDSPLCETAWLLGDARARASDETGAKEAYEIVVRDGRKSDKFTLSRFFSAKNRDTEEALRLIEEEKKTRGGVYIEDAYAWALYRAQRVPEAKAASAKAMALHTPDPHIIYHAGAILMASGDVDEGKKLVKRALDLSPQFDVFEADDARKLLGK